MKFLGIQKMIEGLQRGAEKFGSKIAEKNVKKAEMRNGFAPTTSEPYGLGQGGADTEQMSQVPTQAENVKIGIPPAQLRQQNKLDFLKRELPLSQDKAEREAIEYEIKGIEAELAKMPKGDPDARQEKKTSFSNANDPQKSWDGATRGRRSQWLKEIGAFGEDDDLQWDKLAGSTKDSLKDLLKELHNEDSSALGFQSAEKTTTAHRSEEMSSKCLGCGFESPEAWKGKCEGCGLESSYDIGGKNLSGLKQAKEAEMGDNKETKDDVVIANADQTCAECGVDLSAEDHRKSCALNERANAGHLTSESWQSAATEERAVWLELAQQDINLATKNWVDLSSDLHVALQDAYEMPQTSNTQPLANDAGLMKHFTFLDTNGEEETVEAADENAAWEKLAHDFATPLAELKGMGMKLVNTNEKTNDGEAGDLEEIARHAEGIEHEVEELAEEGLSNCAGNCGCTESSHKPGASSPCACTCPECKAKKEEYRSSKENSVGEEQAKEIWFSANMNRLEGLLEHLGLAADLAQGRWEDISAATRDQIRPHLRGEWSSGNSAEMKNSGIIRGSSKYGSRSNSHDHHKNCEAFVTGNSDDCTCSDRNNGGPGSGPRAVGSSGSNDELVKKIAKLPSGSNDRSRLLEEAGAPWGRLKDGSPLGPTDAELQKHYKKQPTRPPSSGKSFSPYD